MTALRIDELGDKELLRHITQLTTRIATEHPELYKYLEENPLTLPTQAKPEVDIPALRSYLVSLRRLLSDHLRTHGTRDPSDG
ncbi:MAG: hypothetical protein KDB88_01295 [Flavobacteriales bacterium]|nr:hypothetical protein [Flavobacteriales bacterium]